MTWGKQWLLLLLLACSLAACTVEEPKAQICINEIGLEAGQMKAAALMLPNAIDFSYKENARRKEQDSAMNALMPGFSDKQKTLDLIPLSTYSIGEPIPKYELRAEGVCLTEYAFYPVFNGDQMVLAYEMFFDYENEVFGTAFYEDWSNAISNLWKPNMKLALIEDRNACYAYDGETLTYLLRTPEDLELDIMPEDYVKSLDEVALSTVNAVTLPLEQIP